MPVAIDEDVSTTDHSYILTFTIRQEMDIGVRVFITFLSSEESNHVVYIWEISIKSSQDSVCLQFHVTYIRRL